MKTLFTSKKIFSFKFPKHSSGWSSFSASLKGHPAIEELRLVTAGPQLWAVQICRCQIFWISLLVTEEHKKLPNSSSWSFSTSFFQVTLNSYFLSPMITFEGILLFLEKHYLKNGKKPLDFAYNFNIYSNFLNFSFLSLNSVRT